MGMAASQARFLGITARKTNTEYEGQQVNQQRTALANQSANLFNQLLGLDLPVPPSKSDSEYTKTVYAFTDDAGQKATIESIVNNPDTASNVQWPKIVKYTTSENKSVSYRNNLFTTGQIFRDKNDDGTYSSWINIGGGSKAQLYAVNVNDLKVRENIYNELVAKGKTETEATEATNNLYRTKDNSYINIGNSLEFTAQANKHGTTTPYNIFKVGSGYEVEGASGRVPLIAMSATETSGLGDGLWYKTDRGSIFNLKGLEWTATDVEKYAADGASAGKANVTIGADGKYKIGADPIEALSTGAAGTISDVDLMMLEEIQKTYADTQGDTTFYRYTLANQAYYIPASQTNGTFNGSDFKLDKSNELKPPYGYFVQDTAQNVTKEYKASATYDASGRLQSIMLDNGSADTYAITVNSVTDEDKYEDAMNQYKYDMAQYEKTVEDINAQTEAIQVQDRTLELRLKQLDTEQEALTQEMDAIKKVIDKNVETTFKTFA